MLSEVTLNKIPSVFLQWLASSRINFLEEMRKGSPMRYFSAHLPVMSTWNSSPFPVNMTVKGIGLIPRTDHLHTYTDLFESVISEAGSMPWEESRYKRIEAIQRLYGDAGHFDPALLGGLEIFEGKTLSNLRKKPSASLLYAGMQHTVETTRYISFQVNGEVEILNKGNPYYRFLLASRKLFEFDRFHIYQPDYPLGYLIKVIEVIDKSPWSRSPKHEKDFNTLAGTEP